MYNIASDFKVNVNSFQSGSTVGGLDVSSPQSNPSTPPSTTTTTTTSSSKSNSPHTTPSKDNGGSPPPPLPSLSKSRILIPTTIIDNNNNNNNNNNIDTNNNNVKINSNSKYIPFFSGNPLIEVTEGIIHLFVDSDLAKQNQTSSLCNLPSCRSNLICVESVPSYMSIPDLIHFFSQTSETVCDMKIIRDASPNRYMVLLSFVDQSASDEFYQLYSGKKFTSMEPETCILLFVSKVEYQSPSNGFLITPTAATSSSSLIELPTCPVCLERLDSSATGVVTVLCHHTFHCDCLSKWRSDNTCPVCRYVQIPEVESNNVCSSCATTESLWICIICGNVGCSRYVNSHANQHYEETMHTYALELETQRVWDYAGDGYVHRLIQNRSDGKVLEFPNPHSNSDNRSGSHLKEEKIESIAVEYNFLLTSQLEQQRAYFEQQILKIEKDNIQHSIIFKEEIEKLNAKWQTKCNKLKQKCDEVDRESKFLRQINNAMKDNQDKYKQKDEEKDATIRELSEELRDLRFFIEAQKTISENNEMKDASLVVGAPPPKSKNKNKKK
ncbi:Hypothetical RING finger protein [Heterostelium album PN500]|uniref:Hypothetical RING finger protein n=1 Tax=Heterostelium pallidum (strain ATCC 26659 / Pp 5 / PN500) TaxID=670386 RepID=D3B886_HETP5|nr:Hypothetical RING finger protein [Heterostelium album PN500]EFA82254.1 Hypothetical RING finger protein [Heterostelium album PN500]|eukprot:XP_020434371.1 Hypothetical RING finger protein [Heterostelium album PN500]